MTICQAPAGHGIKFKRVDMAGDDNIVPADWHHVINTVLSTNLMSDFGATVSTVEHILAALAGCGVTNALIKIDGPEVPIMDGSSRQFVAKIRQAGLVQQAAPAFVWQVLKTVTVSDGNVSVSLSPLNHCEINFAIDFENTVVGKQSASLDLRGLAFAQQLADCRTFCRQEDIVGMKKSGLAQGGSLDNALVFDAVGYLNPEGPRRFDECVRHKMLDAVGDLSLAGAPILGNYVAIRAGHRMTHLLLQKLFSAQDAVIKKVVDDRILAVLPGIYEQESGLRRTG